MRVGTISTEEASARYGMLAQQAESLKASSMTLGKYAAIAAAIIARQNPATALRTATIALENDFSMRDSTSLTLKGINQRLTALKQSDEPYAKITRSELLSQMEDSLRAAGATAEEIEQILTDPNMDQLIRRRTGSEGIQETKGAQRDKNGRLRIEITEGQTDDLDRTLVMMSQGAQVLANFADTHPHLTHLTLTALNVALSGPTGFLRDQVLDSIGVHENVDHLVSAGKEWFSSQLQDRLEMTEAYADTFSEAGAFGIYFGIGMFGGASKDKIIQSAKETAEKVKIYMTYLKPHPKSGKPYVGRTSGIKDPLTNIARRDEHHHMNKKGFGPAELDKFSTNPNAIRGREQMKIDELGGAKSQGGTSSNTINSISNKNPKKDHYLNEAKKEFDQ